MRNNVLGSNIKSQWNLADIRKAIMSVQNYQYLLSTAPLNSRLTLELFLLDI